MTTVLNGEQTFSPQQLDDVLLELDDIFHRLVLQSNYFLLGETAKAAKEGRWLSGNKITLGLPKRYVTPEFKSFLTPEMQQDLVVRMEDIKLTDDLLTFKLRGVPVEVKIINRDYYFFKHPDTVIYAHEDFQIPNPFEKYWKAQFVVR